MACVRKYLRHGYSQKKAVDLAVNECIEKDILEIYEKDL